MGCKVTSSQIAKRLQYRSYTGPKVTGIAGLKNFGYVSSDVVPVSKYWAVTAASLFINGFLGAIASQVGNLYAINPGAPLPSNNGSYVQQRLFLSFQDGVPNPANQGNGVPVDPTLGFRVDDFTAGDSGTSSLNTPVEVNVLGRGRKPLILPAGWALVGHNGAINGAGFIGIQLTLKISFVELPDTQDCDSWF